MTLKPIRRLVAGNDSQGRSVVLFDGSAPNAHPSPMDGCGHTDLWVWNDSPMDLAGKTDDGLLKYDFPGEPQGGHLRVVQRAGRPAGYDECIAADQQLAGGAGGLHEGRDREVGESDQRRESRGGLSVRA